MLQQYIAFFVIFYFIVRVILQFRAKKINKSEFVLWLVFWLFTLAAVVFIKAIDEFVARLGFSASGIDVLLYLAVAWLFYSLFKIRIKLEKQDKNITKIVRHISLDE